VSRLDTPPCGQLGAILVPVKIFNDETIGGWLADFGIRREWQHQGLGKRLVQALGFR